MQSFIKAVLYIKDPNEKHSYRLLNNGHIQAFSGTTDQWEDMGDFFSPAEMENMYWIEKTFHNMNYTTKRLITDEQIKAIFGDD
jgi:hypothetical protein